MCTVSYIPVGNKVLLTSNRDEHNHRGRAVLPQAFISKNQTKMIYPQDPDKGGSWIGVNNRGLAAVLLNGAFIKHVEAPHFTKSRGLVLLEHLDAADAVNYFRQSNLAPVAPFTLILYTHQQLYECRWDGIEHHVTLLNSNQPHLWSSVTLYDEPVITARNAWFQQWLSEHPSPQLDDILHFHRFAGDGDALNNLVMNRGNKVFTVSITGIEWQTHQAAMEYTDLLTDRHHRSALSFMEDITNHSIISA